ncbi:hypothetical protein NIES2135_62210 (plasmid) [Leptolyngbya boryana NIES-2135]|jgi:hypothetical protein|uniref:Uncharacterized protein n=1 Tax=Leptolyngbya boryana NIES-2135 TaxID=1973484 RepID=A0A1Z4JRL8_LEPBY|nr:MULTISPECIES: hypothetical protein [Leptolyngbya]BAY59344.1 hypothetical protein NIES2135_62210 [Leptolyngbya boryana NIES-2135]MBD2372931.1 hypothetical protein [Leptolyngbya sp. FACHB-238]MBD2397316.1 hypothetical protein [Leptolyngbya sp. FACHB-239]MBD2403879.1 hypothetical protein [Leptolyngbya sp. FACHB-402]ULP33177.1 hypothetical protein MCP04_30875 [Leptolyngbya boryana IU 594]
MLQQLKTEEHLSPEVAQAFLEGLPMHVREALEANARDINYPVWAVVEMAISGYLNEDALSFRDLNPAERKKASQLIEESC